MLSRTPSALRALLDGLPEAWLNATEGEGTFSPRDVLGHLIHGEKTDWIPRIRHILEVGEREPFVPFDRAGFREIGHNRPIGQLLDDFEACRKSSLDYVRKLPLTEPQLSLPGHHPDLGRVTLGQLLATWAVHDLDHISQIVRVMSKRYTVAVGPWKAYLGILNR